MRRSKIWTDEALIVAVKNNLSVRGVLKELGLVQKGGNYRTIKEAIKRLNIDTSHFTGQLWNKGKHAICNPAKPLKDLLRKGTVIQSYKLKQRLIRACLKEEICECCGNLKWLGAKIPLELHHIDGDHTNNELSNLRLLCPNCHALTDNYRGKNIKGKVVK